MCCSEINFIELRSKLRRNINIKGSKEKFKINFYFIYYLRSLLKENINLNTLVMLDNASGFVQEPEYKKWLLNFTSDHQWESNHSSDHECEIDLNTNNKRRDSFEFVDMNDGKLISFRLKLKFIKFMNKL